MSELSQINKLVFPVIIKPITEDSSIGIDENSVASGVEEVARQIAQSHHEHWDGSGYPDGLQGEAIPLAARIMAMADVFDALTSKRVYKEAIAVDQAVANITAEKGRNFDPVLVEIFLTLQSEFTLVAQKFKA